MGSIEIFCSLLRCASLRKCRNYVDNAYTIYVSFLAFGQKVNKNCVGVILHNVAMIFLVYSICHNEKALPDRSNYGNNVDRNENNDDQC